MNQALERYSEEEHEAVTTPSGIQEIPEAPTPGASFPIKPLLWGLGFCLFVLALSAAIATSVSFLVDMTALGGGLYATGVLMSSFSMGAFFASVVWALRDR